MNQGQTKKPLSKTVILLFLLLLCALLFLSFYCFNKIEEKSVKTPEVNKTTNGKVESTCAKAGERSISNFDMTKGKTDPSIKPLNCCSGLKNISDKQTEGTSANICAQRTGVLNNLCSPCGNDVCDSQYEDSCNCPEDCK